jgi:hypothetical protein
MLIRAVSDPEKNAETRRRTTSNASIASSDAPLLAGVSLNIG